jgi:PD-(D/E)XK endonuclease
MRSTTSPGCTISPHSRNIEALSRNILRTSVRAVPTPTQKGNIAEAKLAAAAIELDIGVSRPLCEGQRYDLIFDLHPQLLRVQCKWAARKGDVVVVRIRTSRYTPNGYVRTTYDASEVDAIGVYCPELEACYLLPIAEFDGQGYAHLRLSRTRNKQRGAIRMASAYRLGAIAQLGERVSGRHEVAGSSPASSMSAWLLALDRPAADA